MKTALLHMTLLMIVDYVLIIGVCFAAVMFMESDFKRRLQLGWNKLVDGFWSIVYRVKMAVRKGINFTLKELQKIIEDIKRSELWDSFKHYTLSLLCLLFWVIIFSFIFLFIIWLHKQYPVKIDSQTTNISYFEYIWNFLTNNSLIVSIAASFIGLFLVFIALRPRLSISDKLVQANNGLLRVAISNKFLFIKLIDIRVELDFMRYDERLKGSRTSPITMNKSDISVIYGLRKGGSKSCYMVHSESGFAWNKDYNRIRCRVIATNSVSGIKHVFEKIYTQGDIIRGAYIGRRIIEEKYRYTMPDSELWSKEINHRCEKLWNISDTIRSAIIPIKLDDDNIREVHNAINISMQILNEEELGQLFPCIDKNKDTIEKLIKQLNALDEFYKTKTNLNPANKKRRITLCEYINKYITYLANCISKDIEDYYKSQKDQVNQQ